MTESAALKAAREQRERSEKKAREARKAVRIAQMKRHVARKAKGVRIPIERAAPAPDPTYDPPLSVLAHDGGSESGAITYSNDGRSVTIDLPPGAVRAMTKIPKGAR